MTDDTIKPDRADRIGLYLAIGVAVIAIAIAGVAATMRLVEVAPGHDIPVVVPLTSAQADLVLGPFPEGREIAIDSITFAVEDPSSSTLFALWAEPIAGFLAIAAGMVIAARLFLRIARGEAFERGSATLLFTGAGIVLLAWLIRTVLTTITSHGALWDLSQGEYDSTAVVVNFSPVLWILLLAAVGTAFQLGERLQRETEGLV